MKKKIILIFVFLCAFFINFQEVAYAEVSSDFISQIVLEFSEQSDKWYGIVIDATMRIFYYMLIFEIVWIGVQAVLGRADIGELFRQFILAIIGASFFLAVINNYQEWTMNIVMGLQDLAGEMTTLYRESDNPFMVGLTLFDYLMEKGEDLDFGEQIIAGLVGIITLFCFSFITARIILIKCEVIIGSVAALILVAFGASQLFREYAINTLRYILSVAFKLFVMQLIIGVSFTFFTDITNKDFGMPDFGVILGFVLVLTVLCMSLPETIASIVNGSHLGSGAGMGAVASMTGGAIGGAIGSAIGGGLAVSNAAKIAKEQGASGAIDITRGAFSAMKQARHQGQLNRTNMGVQLKDNLNTLRELNK